MRPIDADALYAFLTEQIDKETGAYSKGRNAGLNIARSALHDKTITPTIAPPPNGPLTLEELREMDGEPAYFVNIAAPDYSFWGIVMVDNIFGVKKISGEGKTFQVYQQFLTEQFYGKVWLAYRRKPEEGMT